MAKPKQRQKRKKQEWKHTLKFELAGLTIFAMTCIGISGLGAVGQLLTTLTRFFMGEWYMLLLLSLLILSVYYIWKRNHPYIFSQRFIGVYFIISALLLFSHVNLFELLIKDGVFKEPSVIRNTWELFWMETTGETKTNDIGGGMIGAVLFALFHVLFAAKGTEFIALLFLLVGIILVTGRSLMDVVVKIVSPVFTFIKEQYLAFTTDVKEWFSNIGKKQTNKRAKTKNKKEQPIPLSKDNQSNEMTIEPEEEEVIIQPIISNFQDHSATDDDSDLVVKVKSEVKKEETEVEEIDPIPQSAFIEEENLSYLLPSLDILSLPNNRKSGHDNELIRTNIKKLERTFESFGVKASVKKVHLGPAVTKYEVYPAVGVKVSKIVNLSDDLALALAAKDIRIEAPIPGKSAIGIEVPNEEVSMVTLREVLEAPRVSNKDSKLLIGLGRDISGEAVLAELNKMPHLLVAGATGSGKSVCINGIITSILMRTKPHEVKMMMIDPKMVELNVYNGIPHLLAPVVTDAKKASQALKKVVSEMERRYELFSHTGTRNIEGYNDYIKRQNQEEEVKQPLLPFIVVIVDELADLMMVASSDVEDAITRLAQMARAAGIHLIIATQRPSVDVITGVIKANIPSRIAFSVSSQTDSRTILDMGGAEKLLGRGDMLFLPAGMSKPVRVQGAFLSDQEVEDIVDFVISQQKAQYQENMIPTDAPTSKTEVEDDIFDDAVSLVLEMQTASVSMLQRRFRIGYTRAARLIDAMEERGIVGPYEGSKPREVLMTKSNEEATS
ncbi:FtsK/SpoIIIE family DNA translocase [Bacillus suaedaesalsae]|uniref:DNA translocase FtsK n=1 Tax=Bacillus suaedaesalsae TaxID=2810349 RepID=A0ABS2DIQ9_9BACI|nr:DNA translocase FtsK [Bacillus suaedaesalsae]MBM6618384.1 DNA translocase FtsK [Bacillus suaedaesalsae]